MLTFEVTSDTDQVIDGLGTFKAGETKTLEMRDVEWFWRLRGVPPIPGNIPEGVEVTAVVIEDEEVE